MDRKDFERLVEMSLADGVLTEQEQKVLITRAAEIGITPDELQIYIDSIQHEMQKREQQHQHTVEANKQMAAQMTAAAAAAAKPAEAPQSKKARKCPDCGATLDEYSSRCPECGAEVSPVSTTQVGPVGIEKLTDSLRRCVNIAEKVNTISYTAIPASKTEMLEFLTFSYAQIMALDQDTTLSAHDRMSLRNAWMRKVIEASVKAEIMFKDDKPARTQVEDIHKKINDMQAKFDKNKKTANKIKFGSIGVGFLFFIISSILPWQLAALGSVFSLFGLIFIIFGIGCFVKKDWVNKFIPQ